MKTQINNLNVQLLKIKDQEELNNQIVCQLTEVCSNIWKELTENNKPFPNEEDIKKWVEKIYPNRKVISVKLSDTNPDECQVTFEITKSLKYFEIPKLNKE